MNANRSRSARSSRPQLYQGITPMFWGGSLVIGGVLVAILYCLLTRQLPV
jgi:hypothetical protein